MTAELISQFYNALAARDGEAMAACYHDDIVFEDAAFGELRGDDARDMWRMLCASDTDLTLTHTVGTVTDTTASATWVAKYTFTATGRAVTNNVTASMKLQDGLIIDHRDEFDFWKWASQALGAPGKLLGWTPFLKAKVQRTTRQNLDDFQATTS